MYVSAVGASWRNAMTSPRRTVPKRYASVLMRTISPACTRGSIESPSTGEVRMKNAVAISRRTSACAESETAVRVFATERCLRAG
jgi:hypothetical protein